MDPQAERLAMPASYGIASELTGAMVPWPEVVDRLVAARNYWVCTTRPGGRPHAAPVWGLWFEGALHFCTDAASAKGRNLAAIPSVAVHLESGDDAVMLEGAEEVVTGAAVLDQFVAAYHQKYGITPGLSSGTAPVYRVRLKTALAWREHDFPESATRWRFG
ncbi:MAG: pyridoxamine 5'-phosphate oxidase [Dehalococcoidia bacterium]|nr:pyridoxamine 5'-phosphate oxidase [Dehalococcoidia bacterium]